MAPHINVNFDDVPDEILPVEPGTYEALIKEISLEPTKDGKGTKLVVQMEIVTEGPQQGRRLIDNISTKATTRIKRLAKSAGLEVGAGGLDTEELLEKVVHTVVGNRNYQDPTTGETKTATDVKDYLFDTIEG